MASAVAMRTTCDFVSCGGAAGFAGTFVGTVNLEMASRDSASHFSVISCSGVAGSGGAGVGGCGFAVGGGTAVTLLAILVSLS